jgi:hypothetical protein
MIIDSNSFRFATKVWLTGVFVSPFVFFLTKKGISFDATLLYMIFFFIMLGFIFSAPSWILLIVIVRLLNKKGLTSKRKKVLLIPIGILLTCLSYYLLSLSGNPEIGLDYFLLHLIVVYLIIILGSIIFFKLNNDSDLKGQHITTASMQ